MIVPDTNLLVYAYDRTAPNHTRARKWWEDALSGDEPVNPFPGRENGARAVFVQEVNLSAEIRAGLPHRDRRR